jgi:hypothetical protein
MSGGREGERERESKRVGERILVAQYIENEFTLNYLENTGLLLKFEWSS